MNIILLGAPGAGKGTQAQKISEFYHIPHISTGDIFRKNIQEQTALGKLAKTFIDAGNLVPDDVVIDLINDRLQQEDCKNGYILDGFPRTIPQAFSLEKIQKIDVVINIDASYDEIEQRLSGRRMCECGATYSADTLNGSEICPKCGKKLYIRDDDKIETIRARLKVYDNQTKPLIKYYNDKGLVKNIPSLSIEEEFECIKKVLNSL